MYLYIATNAFPLALTGSIMMIGMTDQNKKASSFLILSLLPYQFFFIQLFYSYITAKFQSSQCFTVKSAS